jgi:hypothetical protein
MSTVLSQNERARRAEFVRETRAAALSLMDRRTVSIAVTVVVIAVVAIFGYMYL